MEQHKRLGFVQWLGIVFAIVFLLLGSLAVLLQTSMAKERLASWISAALSGPQRQVQIDKLEGFIPFRMRIDRISVSDEQGKWLTLDEFFLRWAPLELIRGRIRIDEISAAKIDIARLPQGPEEKEEKGFEPPKLPEKLPSLTIEKLSIPEIRIGEPVAGKSAVFEITGSVPAVDAGKGLATSLHIARIDEGPQTQLDAKITLHGSPTAAAVEIDFKEAEGGWVAAVAGLNEAGPLRLALHGDGTPSAWEGAMDGSSGENGSVHSEIRLQWEEHMQVTMEGNILVDESLIPAKLIPLIGRETLFGFDLGYRPSESVKIDYAKLQGNGYAAQLKAGMDLRSQSMNGEFMLGIADLQVLEQVSGLSLAGKLAASGRFAGPLKQPEGAFTVELEQVRANEFLAESISTEVRLSTTGPPGPGFPGTRVAGKGEAIGLSSTGEKSFPEKRLQWTIAADVPTEGKVTLAELGVIGEYHQLNLTGDFDSTGQVGKIDANLDVKDLRPLADYIGQELSGTAKVHVHLAGDGGARSASGSVRGQVVPSASISKDIASLVGSKLTFIGEGDLQQGDQLFVRTFEVESTTFQFKSNGFMNLTTDILKGDWHLSIPKLDPLAPIAGKSLSGKLEAKGGIAGPINSLEATAAFEGHSVVLNKAELRKFAVELKAKDVPAAPKGNIDMELLKEDARATLSTGFSYGDRRIVLSQLSANAPGSEIRGNLTLDLKKPLIIGNVDGKLKDLGALGGFLGEKLGGSGEFNTRFSQGKEGQDVSLIVKGRGIETSYGRTNDVNLSADLRNVLGFPHGKADLQVLGLQTSGTTVNTLTAKASGDEKRMSFKTDVEGYSEMGFNLNIQGFAAHSNSGDELRLDKLKGHLGEYAINLSRPATVRKANERLSLDELVLGFGPGQLRASGSMDEKQVTLDIDFKKLPVGISRLFKGPHVNGSAAGTLQLNGELFQPRASLDLSLSDVRSSDPSYRNLPPAFLVFQGRLERGLLNAIANVQGPTQKPARAEISVPVHFSIEPFAFSLPKEGEIKGHLDAEADLAALARFIPLEGQTISGRGTVNLVLRGRLGAPEINGAVTVQNGSYQNFETGTLLKNLEARVIAVDRKLKIEEFRATDGSKGAISATGSLNLAAAGDYTAGVDISISDAKLVRTDEITGTVNGDLKFSGSIKKLSLKGNLTAGPAEINLPQRLPPEVRELDVIEIHGGKQKAAVEEKREIDAPVEMALDLRVNLPNRIFVRGWGLDSVWAGNLQITGATGNPVITGSLSPIRGSFDFVNRRFKIVEGTIGFYGNVPPLPYIDITAESEVKELTARLHLIGSGSDMKITLESEPPMPSDEILAQLMFGRSTTSISPTQALRLASAVNALAGVGGENLDILERTRKLLLLDTLEYREAEGEKFGQGSVGIGKYLTEDIYVNVEKGVGQQTDKASVEVEITPNITVESRMGSDAQGGIGINWKYDY